MASKNFDKETVMRLISMFEREKANMVNTAYESVRIQHGGVIGMLKNCGKDISAVADEIGSVKDGERLMSSVFLAATDMAFYSITEILKDIIGVSETCDDITKS